jgi:cold shock CspA family protein
MKVTKNPKEYKLFTDREKDIPDGNLGLITQYDTAMIKLYFDALKRGGFVASPENMAKVFLHIRTLTDKNFNQLVSEMKTFIPEKKEKQPKTKKSNGVVFMVDGKPHIVDTATGIAKPITVEKEVSSK